MKSRFFLTLVFVLAAHLLAAQQDANRTFDLYIRGEIGASILPNDFIGYNYAPGLGLRFLDNHMAGLEFRGSGKNSCCNNYAFQGFGGSYFYTIKGFEFGLSAGKIIDASRTWDGSDVWVYDQSGYYWSGSFSYVLPTGFFVGFNILESRNSSFEYYVLNDDKLVYNRDERVGFLSGSINLGFQLFPTSRTVFSR